MELASKYNPADVEGKWYQYWLDHHLFSSKPDGREPYTIVIPPPNVTGVLHMGHMLNNTIQDILVRRARMEGKNACWVPGTDHASIATEAKVVNKLAAQGIKKTDLTRDEFLKHAWDWTDEHGGIILKQLRKLGASCDWDRTAFTLDEKRSESVIKVFVDLYNKGLIYRGVRMVNWDPKALTALSDEEVIYKEEHGKLYYLRYKVEGDPEGRYAVVATTRPETIMGDTAMCINPNDPKNEWLKGKKVIVPLVNRAIPVIEDDYVDIEFGTGCLKVTPAHDVNDYMLGEKYNLPSIDIFNDNGTLSEAAGMYIGMDRFDVRIQIEKDLEAAGLLDKTEAYTNKVGYSERTNVVIEPKLSMQWFLKMQHFADMALPPVMNDELKFYPAKYKNTYRYWMENIKAIHTDIKTGSLAQCTIIVEDIDAWQVILFTQHIVVHIMRRSYFQTTCTELNIHIIIFNHRDNTIYQRNDYFLTFQPFVLRVVRIDTHSGITHDRFRTGSSYHGITSFRITFYFIAQIIQFTMLFLVDNFFIGKGSQSLRIPVYHTYTTVN